MNNSDSTTAPPRPASPASISRIRTLVVPALRAEVDRLGDPRMRRVAGYQLGWCDVDGNPAEAAGKAIRPTLAVLAAEAVCGSPEPGVPAAVAVELVHNFSLLHDDIMDRDIERRHRPTGWVAFGEGQAILGGNAMLTAAIDVLLRTSPHAVAAVPVLLDTVQQLISGQSADLALERRTDATLEEVLEMESGKTAALLAGSLALGAIAADAPARTVERLAEAGRLLGLAFQLVDDVLGVMGDPGITGKSASSDVRAGKRSAPVVAALTSGTPEARRLAQLFDGAPPKTDEAVAEAVSLLVAAGGVRWASEESERLTARALDELAAAGLPHPGPLTELEELARFLVRRVW